jgi:CubicO group peptidase (beta-lactamase class C family)
MRALIAFTSLLIAMPASAQQPDQASLDPIFADMSGNQNPGCAVAVGEKGATVLTGAYGSADLEHGVQITPATIFEAGSVSKQFTAAAILLLVEDGKLQLWTTSAGTFPSFRSMGRRLQSIIF